MTRFADQCDEAQEVAENDLKRALARIKKYRGESATECCECSDLIPIARQLAVPGVVLCAPCQELNEARSRQRGVV